MRQPLPALQLEKLRGSVRGLSDECIAAIRCGSASNPAFGFVDRESVVMAALGEWITFEDAIQHVGITTSNLSRSVDFYTSVMGGVEVPYAGGDGWKGDNVYQLLMQVGPHLLFGLSSLSHPVLSTFASSPQCYPPFVVTYSCPNSHVWHPRGDRRRSCVAALPNPSPPTSPPRGLMSSMRGDTIPSRPIPSCPESPPALFAERIEISYGNVSTLLRPPPPKLIPANHPWLCQVRGIRFDGHRVARLPV